MTDEPIYTIFGIDKADDIVDRLTEWTSIGWDETDDTLLEHDISEAAGEIVRLRSLLDGVDNLHRKIRIRLDDGEIDEVCDQCDDLWPCVTHVFLHAEESSDE